MADTEQVRSLLALLEFKGVGPGTVKKNLDQIRASLTAPDVFASLLSLIGEKANEGDWQSALGTADQHRERCGAVGITMISILDTRYPSSLIELSTPPPVLFCRGNLSLLSSPTLGMIGTRKSNQFGETVAGRIGRHFVDNGVTLCNGLADGIDICSVTPGGTFLPRVIGVMACGLDLLESNLSSKRTRERAQKLLDADGLLVSELPPGADEDQNTVIASCRVQAGLSDVLLLVQSSSDGGSRFTVGNFCKLARRLAFIVPPEAQSNDSAFEANRQLSRGEEGLAEFVGLKTAKSVKASLLPIRSRSDYDSVMREFREPMAPSVR
jgi:DNA processing protein